MASTKLGNKPAVEPRSAIQSNNWEALYALMGSLSEFPLEAERKVERQRESVQLTRPHDSFCEPKRR
jgi:hypothetical protein